VQKLPPGLQERLDEEWRAFIEETPGNLSRLARAYGLSRAANRIFRGAIECSLAERLISQSFGAIWLVSSPAWTIIFFGLYFLVVRPKLEKGAPLLRREVITFFGQKANSFGFVLGDDRVSAFLSRCIGPFHCLAVFKGDVVLTWKDWRYGLRQICLLPMTELIGRVRGGFRQRGSR
jgi:hypothetical protein